MIIGEKPKTGMPSCKQNNNKIMFTGSLEKIKEEEEKKKNYALDRKYTKCSRYLDMITLSSKCMNR